MYPRRTCITMLALTLVVMTGTVCAAGAIAGGDSLLPVIPEGRGENCVEDTDYMRRNHMELLSHQRDETTLKGVRTDQYSLKECLNCHVVYGPDSAPVTVSSPTHFCRSCHDYTAVSIDCFECHASRPEAADLPGGHQVGAEDSSMPVENGTG